jgi:hypothetical protein
MSFKETLESHPVVWLSSVVVAVVVITVAVESRYAKAEDVSSAKVELSRSIANVQKSTEVSFLRQRKSSLEDKLFELEAKKASKGLSEVELKQYFRWKTEYDEVVREIRQKSKGD